MHRLIKMCNKRDINYLIRLYNKPYVKGEKRSKEYERMMSQEKTMEEKKRITEDLFAEIPFHLTQYQKDHVLYLIEQYPDLTKLHGNAKTETIILAIIFYVRMGLEGDIRLDRDKYKVISKYNLKHTTFELITCRLAFNYLENVNIIPRYSTKYDHGILYKGRKK